MKTSSHRLGQSWVQAHFLRAVVDLDLELVVAPALFAQLVCPACTEPAHRMWDLAFQQLTDLFPGLYPQTALCAPAASKTRSGPSLTAHQGAVLGPMLTMRCMLLLPQPPA